MRTFTKLTIAVAVLLGPSVAAVGAASEPRAGASQVEAQQAAPTITIADFKNDPADLAAKVGQAITVTNNDAFPHTVTANDGTFNVEVPANGTVNLTVPKPGAFPYTCTIHPGQHNPASITVS